MARIHFCYFDLYSGFFPSFNHGLAYLIGTLRSCNHEVQLSHLIEYKDFESTVRAIEKQQPDMVALSITYQQKEYANSFLKTLKYKPKLIIAGGIHCTLLKEKVFDEIRPLDGVCIGEGEIPLKELCNKIDNNADYSSTPSFCFREGNNIKRNQVSPLQELDDLPLPDYSLFDLDRTLSHYDGHFPMILSRGCPYKCTYCCNQSISQVYPDKNNYVRFPSVEHSIKVINNNLSICPQTKQISFHDDTFTLNKRWLFDFCAAYKKEIDIPFFCHARVETVDEDVVRCLKDSGCVQVAMGVESGNEWLRRIILNRKHSNKKMLEAFRLFRKYGIKTFSYNMVGLPFETREMAQETLDLNIELKPDHGFALQFFPFPGSSIYDMCQKYDLLPEATDVDSGIIKSLPLKEVFMSVKDREKCFESLQLFFYARIVLSKFNIPVSFEKIIIRIMMIFRKPLAVILIDDPKHSKKVRSVFRLIVRGVFLKGAKNQ